MTVEWQLREVSAHSLHLFTCVTLMHSHELQDKEQRIVELNEAEKIEPFRRRQRCK